MNPRTGEVLALANWPRIDANAPGAAPGYATQNRAVGYTYEPGSTFKAFTVAGRAAGRRRSRPTRRSTCRRRSRSPTATSASRIRAGPMTLTTAQILAQSSNVGAIKIGLGMGKQRFDYWVRKFGFGKPTGVDLPGEERGLVLPVDKYSGSSMGNLPIGQGLSVTPMQMAAGLRGDRQRRRSCARRASCAASTASSLPEPQGQARHLAHDRAAAAHDARGRLRARRHGQRGRRSPATSSRARPARRTRSTRPPASTRSPTTSPRSWASRRRCTPSC